MAILRLGCRSFQFFEPVIFRGHASYYNIKFHIYNNKVYVFFFIVVQRVTKYHDGVFGGAVLVTH